MATDVEQRLAKIEEHVADIESHRASERREYLDVMERIFSKLNDLHTRITVQHEHTESIKTITQRISNLEIAQNQVVGGWKVLGVVGSVMVTLGALIAWLFEHAPKAIRDLNH